MRGGVESYQCCCCFLQKYNPLIIMYIYHALINALSTHVIHINLNTIFFTLVEDSPTKTIYIRHYMHTHTHTRARTYARTLGTISVGAEIL